MPEWPAIASACGYAPVFVISKRARPVLAWVADTEILNSRSVTRIVDLEPLA